MSELNKLRTQIRVLRAAIYLMRSEPDCVSYPKRDVYDLHEPEDVDAPLWSERGLYGRVGKEAARTLLARHGFMEDALEHDGEEAIPYFVEIAEERQEEDEL